MRASGVFDFSGKLGEDDLESESINTPPHDGVKVKIDFALTIVLVTS